MARTRAAEGNTNPVGGRTALHTDRKALAGGIVGVEVVATAKEALKSGEEEAVERTLLGVEVASEVVAVVTTTRGSDIKGNCQSEDSTPALLRRVFRIRQPSLPT